LGVPGKINGLVVQAGLLSMDSNQIAGSKQFSLSDIYRLNKYKAADAT
jgi:hypothetical protein